MPQNSLYGVAFSLDMEPMVRRLLALPDAKDPVVKVDSLRISTRSYSVICRGVQAERANSFTFARADKAMTLYVRDADTFDIAYGQRQTRRPLPVKGYTRAQLADPKIWPPDRFAALRQLVLQAIGVDA